MHIYVPTCLVSSNAMKRQLDCMTMTDENLTGDCVISIYSWSNVQVSDWCNHRIQGDLGL